MCQHLVRSVRLWREGQMVLRSALVLCARLFPRPIRTRGDARRGEAGLMHTHSCHDALTLARHATATRVSRYPAGCTLMMRQISCHACDIGRHPIPRTRGLWADAVVCCMAHARCHGASHAAALARPPAHVACRCIPGPTLAPPAVPNVRSVGADRYMRVIRCCCCVCCVCVIPFIKRAERGRHTPHNYESTPVNPLRHVGIVSSTEAHR
jgi:hypothetical protein